MPQLSQTSIFDDHGRSDLVRLSTLAWLRWLAVGGQSVAVAIGYFALRLDLPLAAIGATIGALAIANLIFGRFYAHTKTGSSAVALFLIFDLAQLALLLALTGGLNNPFAMLMLAPSTIGASVLPLRWAALSTLIALALVSLIGLAHLPLARVDGAHLSLAPILRLGYWASLMLGIVFLGYYSRQVWTEIEAMQDALVATREALAREQKLAALSGVVAATAHELGTPLATIKLVSRELSNALEASPDLREDADLIHQQADRCRDILRQMGHSGQDGHLAGELPLQAIVEEAAAPHRDRCTILIETDPAMGDPQPSLPRLPEILHSLRNLIQNGADFAESTVRITLSWSPEHITLRVWDDGPGFPPHLIGRLGDPLIRPRARPGAEGMGLGLFISKTLLGRTGARLRFANAAPPEKGAQALVTWDRALLKSSAAEAGEAVHNLQMFTRS